MNLTALSSHILLRTYFAYSPPVDLYSVLTKTHEMLVEKLERFNRALSRTVAPKSFVRPKCSTSQVENGSNTGVN